MTACATSIWREPLLVGGEQVEKRLHGLAHTGELLRTERLRPPPFDVRDAFTGCGHQGARSRTAAICSPLLIDRQRVVRLIHEFRAASDGWDTRECVAYADKSAQFPA